MAKQPDPIPPEGTPPPSTEGYLTAKKASERMGLSVETVRAMCNDRALPDAVLEYGRWHVPSDAVEAWLRRQSEGTAGSEGGIAAPADVPSASPGKQPGPPTWWLRFRYNPWAFYPITVLSALIIIVGVLFGLIQAGADFGGFSRQVKEWGLVREFPAERKGETLIVIAQFYHPEGIADTEAHKEIRDAIQAAAQELGESTLRVVVSSVPLAADDQDGAEKLGKRYNASIVVWGAYTGVRVTVNFLNLKHPDFHAAQAQINETQRTQIANPSAYASFVTRSLPSQLSFLSLFAVGQSYYTEGAYENSSRLIEKGIAALAQEDDPVIGLAEAYFRLAWLYQTLDRWQEAIDRYTQAIQLHPSSTSAHNNRGLARAAQGDLDGAIQDYDKAIELDPQDVNAYHNRGNARYAQGQLVAAIQDFDKASELDPQAASAYNNRGLVRAAQGQLVAAIQDYDKVIELDSQRASAYHNRGDARYAQGQLDAAIQDYDKAIELDPQRVGAYDSRGIARADQGDLAAAIQDFDKAIELDPQRASAYHNRGLVRHDQGYLTAAIQDYDKAIELDPHTAAAYFNRGNARYAQGQLAVAIQDYDKAIELNPQDAGAYNNRGNVRADQGDLAAAIQDYDKANELDPQAASVYVGRGLTRYLQGNLDAALADFRRYLELSPNASDRQQVEGWIAELEQ